jgi:UDP-2-acetamido-2,6-beta-L-arabino-hexul-4-ose reductase
MNILVTGARGFLGRNLIAHLQARQNCVVTTFDLDNSRDDLRVGLETADIVYHLAGVNRPQVTEEFEIGNAGLTRDICEILRQLGRTPVIAISSSVQAALDNPYGISKRHAEEALREFGAQTGARVCIYRLMNVFGKWCRPNYNSVVATFCHNIANDLPIQISDAACELELVYVDDVVKAFLAEIQKVDGSSARPNIPSFKLTLSDLASRIQSFHEMGANLLAPDFSVRFNQQLYATYLSYVPEEARRLQLQIRSDQRGSLAEFIKSNSFGQIFVSRTKPGVTRGNHYHHTKTEKFLVVEGEGIIRLRHIESTETSEYFVCGEAFQVVDIPPGYTHSIENIGVRDMVTLFWASEVFCPESPDTYFVPVVVATDGPVAVST